MFWWFTRTAAFLSGVVLVIDGIMRHTNPEVLVAGTTLMGLPAFMHVAEVCSDDDELELTKGLYVQGIIDLDEFEERAYDLVRMQPNP